MANFKFRLEFLRKYRKDVLTKAQKDFFNMSGELNAIDQKVSKAKSDYDEILARIQANLEKVGEVKLFSEVLRTQGIRIELMMQDRAGIQREVDNLRRWVEHLHRELKVVENLKDKQKLDHEKEIKVRERKQIDGWVVERWNRS